MTDNNKMDIVFMKQALAQANLAQGKGEVPIGAVLTLDDEMLAESHNSSIELHDPSAHAEILVLRKAARDMANYRLPRTTLYVTLEPCAMCFMAMVHARIERLVFGAADPKQGAVGGAVDLRRLSIFNHRFEVCGGILAKQCSALLVDFFKHRRCLHQ